MTFKAEIKISGASKEIFEAIRLDFEGKNISYENCMLTAKFSENSLSIFRGKINSFLRNLKTLANMEAFANEQR